MHRLQIALVGRAGNSYQHGAWIGRTQSARSHEGEYYATMERGVDDTRPMTGEQATMLKRLTQAAYELDAFKPNLTRAEADLRIATLTAKLKLLDGPPHTL
jgi:hypothetical protein